VAMERVTHSASEPWISVLLFWLIPPSICFAQYFVGSMMVLMFALHFTVFPWILRVLTVASVVAGGVMVPVWWRTFFDRGFVGMDRPYLVEWSSDTLAFRGCFFDLTVPIERVTKWRVVGFKSAEYLFMLRISVLDEKGRTQVLNLSTSMSNKRALLAHLDKARKRNHSDN
jgi:hypothetical protein